MDETTAQKLADLGTTFNTNPGFGLMGMLNNEDPQQPQQQPVNPPADDKPPEYFDLLNQSIQTKDRSIQETLGNITNKLGSLESRLNQPQPQPQQVADEELDPLTGELNQIKRNQAQFVIDSSWERGRNAISKIRSQHPDTEISDNDLRSAFELNQLAANPELARKMDWELYFDAEHNRRVAPKLNSRVKELESEIQLLKSGNGLADMGSVPRSRSGAPAPASKDDNGIDEDVYKAASARMGKGRFAGFGRVLFEEQQKRRGRIAV